MTELTKVQKTCFKEAQKLFNNLAEKFGSKTARWALNRKMNWEKEKARLAKEKRALENRLSEIEEALG